MTRAERQAELKKLLSKTLLPWLQAREEAGAAEAAADELEEDFDRVDDEDDSIEGWRCRARYWEAQTYAVEAMSRFDSLDSQREAYKAEATILGLQGKLEEVRRLAWVVDSKAPNAGQKRHFGWKPRRQELGATIEERVAIEVVKNGWLNGVTAQDITDTLNRMPSAVRRDGMPWVRQAVYDIVRKNKQHWLVMAMNDDPGRARTAARRNRKPMIR